MTEVSSLSDFAGSSREVPASPSARKSVFLAGYLTDL